MNMNGETYWMGAFLLYEVLSSSLVHVLLCKRPESNSYPLSYISFYSRVSLILQRCLFLSNSNSTSPSSISHLTVILFLKACFSLAFCFWVESLHVSSVHRRVSHFIHALLLGSRISWACSEMLKEHLLNERFISPSLNENH